MKKLILLSLFLSSATFAKSTVNQNVSSIDLSANESYNLNMRFTLAPLTMINSSNREVGYAVDIAVSDNFMVGPQISYFKYSGKHSSIGSYGIGLSTTYSLTENFKNGWFVGSALKFYTYNTKSYLETSSYSNVSLPERNTNLSLMYGYKWFLPDGFNIRFSAGLQYNTDDKLIESYYDSSNYNQTVSSMRGSDINFDSDLSVGLTF